jgi:hypothetical protein
MYKQDNDFANYDGSRVSLISRLRKQVLAVPAPLLCGLLFAAVLALLPISAGAQCANWDASGRIDIVQRGQDHSIVLDLQQKGRMLTGYGFHHLNHFATEAAKVDGTIDGDSFSIQIFWQKGAVGVYNGKVLLSGRLDGEGYERYSPQTRVPWHSRGVLKCLPPPKVLKATGRKPKPTPVQTSQPAPAPMKAPGIIAGAVFFPTPFVPAGFVVLQWDAGPDHPYAEVWFKVNGGEQVFMVEQGKGGRQVTVERGRVYEYILTDAGKTLATVTVVGK